MDFESDWLAFYDQIPTMERRETIISTQDAIQDLSMEVRGIFDILNIAASPPEDTRSDGFFISAHDPLFRLHTFVIG
jgi:hypothetical protein